MKIFRQISFLALLVLLFSVSCKDEVVRTETYMTRVPVYMTAGEIRAQVISPQSPVELSSAGKIYIYQNFLIINEPNKGLHIVNNSNPSKPVFINYINIPGNSDMAINDNILYADSYMDLLAFDISNPADIREPKRILDVFKNTYPENSYGKITGYKDSLVTVSVTSHSTHGRELINTSVWFSSTADSKNYGTGGSTARFTLMNEYLYTVDQNSLKLFNVTSAANPKFINSINLGTGIETIFPYQDKLFIGSTTGMHIYNASNPSNPVKLSTYSHLTSCDPVIVQGKYAYVTLRSGTNCRIGSNLLDVLNIEDPASPKLVSSYPMLNPHGLAISGGTLFICEGVNGLKTFDSSDPLKIGERQFSFLKDLDARDVIAGPASLIVTGKNGIYQYDYSNPRALGLLSQIRVSKQEIQ